MRGGRVLALVLGLVCAAVVVASAVGQAQRELQTLTPETREAPVSDCAAMRAAAIAKTPGPEVTKQRAGDIAACRCEGGIPVPVAGILASEGIGCAQPLGM